MDVGRGGWVIVECGVGIFFLGSCCLSLCLSGYLSLCVSLSLPDG